MHVEPSPTQTQELQYLEIAQLYHLLRLRSLSNPPFLNRTLKFFRNGVRRRRRRMALSELLPIRLCQMTSGNTEVRKRLSILVSKIESQNVRFHRLACFLVKNERLIDSNEFVLPDTHEPGTLLLLSFDYNFLDCRYDERNWIVIGYVYDEGTAEPQAAFELDLAHLFKTFMRRLSDIVIDVALEHPIHETEVGRMQLQLSWWFTADAQSNFFSKPVPAKLDPVTSEITFKYSWKGGKQRHCEALSWTSNSRCPFCFFICPDVRSLVLHVSLSHDRLDIRFHSTTIFLEPVTCHSKIKPVESMSVIGGRYTCKLLTDRILKDRLLTARQADAVDDARKRRRTVSKSVQPAQPVSAPPKPKRSNGKVNGKVAAVSKAKPFSEIVYHHGSFFVPVRVGELPEGYKDSDLEIDDAWILSQQNQTIAMFEDVENDEKELMILWNELRKKQPEIISDKDLAPFCETFATTIRRHDRRLRKALLNHLLVLWEFGLLSSSQVKRIISIYDGRDECPDSKIDYHQSDGKVNYNQSDMKFTVTNFL